MSKDNGIPEDYDNYNELSEEGKMLKRLDMLRKLGELAQYKVKLSQNYNMNSDYFTMKYEYQLHTNIRAKQNLRKLAKNHADNRAQKKQRPNAPPSSAKKSYAMELSFDSDEEDGPYAIPPPIFDDSESDGEGGPNVYPDAVPRPSYAKNLFGFDGGKSRKRTKSHKKQMRNKRRNTHKKGKPKKATRKRK